MQQSHTKESLRCVSVVDANVIWASGTHGTYVITTDAGKKWTPHQVPGAESLDFRGVKAFGSEAFLLAAGPGDKSRIYHTTDFGRHWMLQFANPEPKGFFDCMAFTDAKHGIVVGDPVNGKFQILRTDDGGKNWIFADPTNMPAALDNEGAFAASNSCISVQGNNAWFVTGGPVARVFHSKDRGATWAVAETPIVHGSPSQGIFSVAFKDSLHGVIAGGDYAHHDQAGNNLARTDDAGQTWKVAEIARQQFFSAVRFVGVRKQSLLVVGSGVTGIAVDDVNHWSVLLHEGFNAVDSSRQSVFAVGADGKIGRISNISAHVHRVAKP